MVSIDIDEMFRNIVVRDAGMMKFLRTMFDELSKILKRIEAQGISEEEV